MVRLSTGGAAPVTTITWSAAPADARSRWRGLLSRAGPTGSVPRTASATFTTPSRSSAPAPAVRRSWPSRPSAGASLTAQHRGCSTHDGPALRGEPVGAVAGCRAVHGTAVTSVTLRVDLNGPPQVAPVEVRPERVQEDHLGVGRLPQQEVAGPLLAGGPHEQVDVGHGRLVEVARDGPLVDVVGLEPPLLDEQRDPAGRIGDFGPAAVVDTHRQRHHGVVPGQLLCDLELLDHRPPQPRAPTHPADADAPVVEDVAAAADHVAVETHQESDLVGRPLPVLGGEGVGRDVLDTDLDRSSD